MKSNSEVMVVGHKNPDTDSICSAIAYAELKNRLDSEHIYVPCRAGQMNEETRFVLDRFHMEAPRFLPDVHTQVKDIEIRQTEGVSSGISIMKAWRYMQDNNVVTLPVLKHDKLSGIITINDIAKSYMGVYDSKIMGMARTSYRNIIETLDGELIVGDPDAIFDRGKVLVAAANPDLMEDYIDPDDLVILGNRYESQLCAIEMRAAAIVVCEGARVSKTIQKLAQERSCTVISAPHDTYTVARLINQSMPIRYFMRTDHLVTFQLDDFTDDVRKVMAKKRHRDFPILDENGRYVGTISRRNLLGTGRKKVILVDHNGAEQAVDGIEDADILEIVDHHRLSSVETIAPVFFRCQPLGCTATIIYQMYREQGVEIPAPVAGLLCAAILSDTLMYRSPTCTEADKEAAEALASIAGIDTMDFATRMFRAGSNLANKPVEEIFHQDYKVFSVGDVSFGVGQISSMEQNELDDLEKRLLPYMAECYPSSGVSMIFFMLTNMLTSSSRLLCCGPGSGELARDAFNARETKIAYTLNGIVSRKKQLIPRLMLSAQNEG